MLFSSGSTGAHKAAVHDLARLLDKFRTPRPHWRALVFLQLDHIGGVNTLFHTLANGGVAVVADSRSPVGVCRAIARHRVELLPTSPTFLNLLLLSEEHRRHDLSSLKVITYGTEPMPESTLQRVVQQFPGVSLRQTYGLSELGILRCQSRSNDSLWVRVGGEGYETRIVDGKLRIRAHSAMLGYLNAPSAFDEDGFFETGDLVDTDGEWIRLRGRASDIINVGGSKVYPAEVESVLLDLDNVADVSVSGERNPITGQIVVATIRLRSPEAAHAFKARMLEHCRPRLSAYKIPVRVQVHRRGIALRAIQAEQISLIMPPGDVHRRSRARSGWTAKVKTALNAASLLVIAPCAATVWLGHRLAGPNAGQGTFVFWTHLVSLLPGTPGRFLRRAFYRWTLERCDVDVTIEFGTLFSRQAAVLEEGVYIGCYALIGSVCIGAHSLVGSRGQLVERGRSAPLAPNRRLERDGRHPPDPYHDRPSHVDR